MIRRLANNLGIKITCLILSIFLWYALTKEETITKVVPVYISPKINTDMFLMNMQPVSVDVTLQGSRYYMENIDKHPYSVEIDISSESKAQILQKYLKESDFTFDKHLKIVKTEPEMVEIEVDQLSQKQVEIEAVTEGMVAPNFDLAEIKLIPSRLKISGPDKILRNLSRLQTEKIDLSGMTTNFIQEVQIVPPYTGFKTNQSIKAIISITKSKEEKIFEKIPIKILSSVSIINKFTIKPGEVTLKISASVIDFQGVGNDDFLAFVNIQGLSKGVYELPVYVYKKDLFKMIEINPKSVEVAIE